MQKWRIGVDEAGRGPLAGPVAVGSVLIRDTFDWSLLPGVNDSKQLSEKRREELFAIARQLRAGGKLDFQVALIGVSVIDRKGIVPAIRSGLSRTLGAVTKRAALSHDVVHVQLDGGLCAPDSFIYQETIIKGDAKEKCIGLASVLAKVTRDRYMVRLAKKYPQYGFEIHKGYGTKVHRSCILEHGLSTVHRSSFCRNLLV